MNAPPKRRLSDHARPSADGTHHSAPERPRSEIFTAVLDTAIFAVACVLAIVVVRTTAPEITSATYTGDLTPEETAFTLPLRINSDAQTIRARIVAQAGILHATRYRFMVDDCLEGISVNGERVEDERLPYCNYAQPLTMDLGRYVHAGTNELHATIRNNGGPGKFGMSPSPLDPAAVAAWCVLLLAAGWYAIRVLGWLKVSRYGYILCIIVLLGIGLRTGYMAATPYDVRGYDTEGHLEYVDYLLRERRLPRINEGGWEWYQPPLYYLLLSPVVAGGRMMGAEKEQIAFAIQSVSLVISVAVLLLSVWIAAMVFGEKKHRVQRALFILIVAMFPSLIFFAARVNNDVLLHLCAFGTLGLIIAWWRTDRLLLLCLAALGTALAILSKGNGLLLVPILLGCIALKNGKSIVSRCGLGAVVLLIVLACTGWYFGIRILAHSQTHLVGNIGNLNSGLLLQNTWEHLSTFSPAKILDHPLNDPWSDEARRQFFWEYLYRSAFFGEFSYAKEMTSLAVGILAAGFLMLALSAVGYAHSLLHCWRKHLPLLLSGFILLAGHLAFRIRYPYSSSQDFRYSVLFIVPFAFFAALGTEALPKLRWWTSALAAVFAVLCGIFVLLLTVH